MYKPFSVGFHCTRPCLNRGVTRSVAAEDDDQLIVQFHLLSYVMSRYIVVCCLDLSGYGFYKPMQGVHDYIRGRHPMLASTPGLYWLVERLGRTRPL